MNLPNLLPTLIMIESLIASLIYAIAQRWGPALYWLAGAAITFSATYLIPKGK